MPARKAKQPAIAQTQPDLETHFQNNEIFKNAFQYSAIGMALVSLEGKWLKVNEKIFDILGYAEEELLSLTFQDITHPDDLDLDLKYAQQMIAGKIKTFAMEKRYLRKDGEYIWALLSVSLAKDSEQKPLFFISQIVDINEQKLASRALEESEFLYRDLVENTQALICTHDMQGNLLSVNDTAVKLTGYPREVLLKTNLRNALTPESQENFDVYLETIKKQGTARGEMHVIIANGETRVWEYNNTIRNDGLTEPIVRGMAHDITEQKRADEELQASEKRYRNFFDNSPIPLWEEDYSEVKKRLDELKQQGVTDFRAYFASHPDVATELASLIKVLDINQAALNMYGAKSKEELLTNLDARGVGEIENNPEDFIAVAEGKTSNSWDGADETLSGEPIEISLNWSVVPGHEHDYSKVIVTTLDITKRKQAEQALRASELFAHSTLNALSAHIAVLDKNGIIIAVNQAWRKFAEANPSIKTNVSEGANYLAVCDSAKGVGSEGAKEMAAGIRAVIRGEEKEFLFEYPCHAPHEKRWFRLSVTGFGEKEHRLVVVAHDNVSERFQAQQELQESEERYKSILEDMPMMMCRFKPDGTLTFINAFYCQYFKKSYDELLGSNLFKLIPDEEHEAVKQKYLSLNQKKPFVTHEFKTVDVNGNVRWQKWIDRALFNEKGEIYEYQSIGEDITDEKKAEEKLRISEERYKLSSRATFDAIWDWDLETNQIWWNETFQTLFGYHSDEIEPGPESWLSRIHPDDLLHVETQIREKISSNEHFWSDTYRFRRADGTYAMIEDRGYISRDELGKPLRMIGAMQDITERKQAEEERRVLIDELGERVKELTFLHNISRIFMDSLRPEGEVMQSVVDMLPNAMQYPEITEARIGFNGSQFTTPNFKQTDWMLSEFFEYPGGNLGVVQVAYLEERPLADVGPFLDEERSLLISTAEKLQTYLKGLSADRAINRQLAELETLFESGLEISQLLTPKEIAKKVIGVLERKLDWHHIAIREYDLESNSLKLIGFSKLNISANEAEEYIQKMNSLISNPSQGLSGWVTTHGVSVRVPNVNADERYTKIFPDIHSGIYVPLKIGERVIGSISVESELEDAFTEHDQRLLETLAGQAAIAIENANLFNELEKRVQERTLQIEATKRRLELATHAGQIGVWEYKPRENSVVWDERMHIIHHIAVGDFDGKPETWAKYIHPDDLAKSQINSQLALTENLLLNNEHRIILPDGNIRYLATSAVTVFGEDNTPDRIIGICRDVTERKQIEKNLEESESYARLLFDAAPDPVFVMESDGTMVDVNKIFEMQHQINRESLQGKNISALNLFPPEELRRANEYLTEVMTGESVPPVELKFYAPDDELHTLELHSYPIEVQGRTLVLSTSRDITTHKKFEEALKLANAEMENALKVKDEFLANMSHELRTPLNAILGISESLEEQMIGTLNEKQQKYVGIIKESGKHLLDLINDILDISKIEAGRMELTVHPIGVEKLCQASLRMIKELAQKKKIQVSFKIHGEVATIMGDERRLKQVLVNLLSNAVKFTEENNKIGLEVKGYPQRNEVTFSVWDTGIGIAEEDLKFLFKPFVQLDAGLAREFQGTGLGLALVAQMVRLHGGSVNVKSQIGKGSMFTITLPWEAEEQNAPAKVTGKLVLPSQKPNGKRKSKILLVEDTDIIVSLVKDYLTYKGYEVIVAYNGREGIYLAKEKQPDLILMDVMMPIMNGIDATIEMRKDKNLSHVPIIALTALAMPGDRERCLEAGMTDYMSKPVQLNELIEIIEKYVIQH